MFLSVYSLIDWLFELINSFIFSYLFVYNLVIFIFVYLFIYSFYLILLIYLFVY